MKALECPVGHPQFVAYPRRWIVHLNDKISDQDIGDILSVLIKDLKTVLTEAEHENPMFLAEIVGIMLWASISCGDDYMKHMVELAGETSLFKSILNGTEKTSHILTNILTSTLGVSSSYLRTIAKCINHCTSFGPDNVSEMLGHRFSSTAQTFSVDRVSNIAYKQQSYEVACKSLAKLVDCDIPFIQEKALWNLSVALKKMRRSSECVRMLETGSQLRQNTQLFSFQHDDYKSEELGVNSYSFHSQLCILSSCDNNNASCKKYCRILSEGISLDKSDDILDTIYNGDIAYLLREESHLIDLISKLEQSTLLDDILHSTPVSTRHHLALGCLNIALSHLYLDKEDTSTAYKYFSQSNTHVQSIEDNHEHCFEKFKSLFLGQFHNVEGYFAALEGRTEDAAISYCTSYGYDDDLDNSLYNCCLMLLKLRKGLDAQRSWSQMNTRYYEATHPYAVLTRFLFQA